MGQAPCPVIICNTIIRHQPDSALSQWFHDRTQGQKGRIRRVMIVALARKLAIALWRYLETGLIPEGAVVNEIVDPLRVPTGAIPQEGRLLAGWMCD